MSASKDETPLNAPLTRRQMLKLGATASAVTMLASCGGSAEPTPAAAGPSRSCAASRIAPERIMGPGA